MQKLEMVETPLISAFYNIPILATLKDDLDAFHHKFLEANEELNQELTVLGANT